jgi:hypothetical protein
MTRSKRREAPKHHRDSNLARWIGFSDHFWSGTVMSKRTETLELSLSAKGLANSPINQHNLDFTFVVGDFKYSCPSFVADFLCPRLGKIHQRANTFSKYVVESQDPNNYFDQFLSLGYRRTISISTSSLAFFKSICSEFQNREIYDGLFAGDNSSHRRHCP